MIASHKTTEKFLTENNVDRSSIIVYGGKFCKQSVRGIGTDEVCLGDVASSLDRIDVRSFGSGEPERDLSPDDMTWSSMQVLQ